MIGISSVKGRASKVFSGSGTRLTRILSMELGEQLPLFVPLREQEEDERCSQQDCDDPCKVGPLGARMKRRLGPGYDLVRILRILLRETGRARERLLQGRLSATFDLLAVGCRSDRLSN